MADNIKKFIKFCQNNFSYETSTTSTTSSTPPTTTTNVNYHYNYPLWSWFPLMTTPSSTQTQNVYVNNIQDSKKSDGKKKKDDDKKDDDNEFSTLTKVSFFIFGMSILAGGVHYLTKDYVEYLRLREGYRKAKSCKKDIKNDNSMYPELRAPRILELVVKFNKLYKHTYGYYQINMLSKAFIVLTSSGAFIGGMLRGQSFFDNHLDKLMLLFGSSLATYIINRTYYSMMYSKEDKRIRGDLKDIADELMPLPVNPEVYQ